MTGKIAGVDLPAERVDQLLARYAIDHYGSPDQVAALVSDLQWMQAECQRANAVHSPPAPVEAPPVDWSASPGAGIAA